MSDPEGEESPGSVVTVDVGPGWENIWATQQNISPFFRDKRPLEDTIEDLKTKRVNPMTNNRFILKAFRATLVGATRKVIRFYTFDHRRAWCMYKARCTRVPRTQLLSSGRIGP